MTTRPAECLQALNLGDIVNITLQFLIESCRPLLRTRESPVNQLGRVATLKRDSSGMYCLLLILDFAYGALPPACFCCDWQQLTLRAVERLFTFEAEIRERHFHNTPITCLKTQTAKYFRLKTSAFSAAELMPRGS